MPCRQSPSSPMHNVDARTRRHSLPIVISLCKPSKKKAKAKQRSSVFTKIFIFVQLRMFKPGSIRKVQVKDFVTYSYTEFYPGPSLNMVIGPNGTGKSTIVSAIILGLGGNPKVIGRGTKISEYVKHKCKEASITIHLQGDMENDYIVIKRQFDTQERSKWELNGQRVNLHQVMDCTKRYNIQVDNLCQFLPQDRVQDFAKLDKKELLKETQIALCREDLSTKQSLLVQNQSTLLNLTNSFKTTTQKLQDAQDANIRLEGKVTNYNKKLKFLHKIENIDRKVAWLQFEEIRHKFDAREVKQAQATRDYEKLKNAIKPGEAKITAAKKAITDYQTRGNNITRAMKSIEDDVRHKFDLQDQKKRSLNSIKEDMNLKLAEMDQADQEIEATIAKVEEMKRHRQELVNQFGNDEHTKERTQQIRKEIDKHNQHLRGLEDKKERINELKQNEIAESRKCDNEILRLENIKQQRLEYLKRINPHAYEAVIWLRENQHRFQDEVYEPILLELNVLEPKNTRYVENTIAMRDKVAFTCVNKDDMNLLIGCLRGELKLKVNILFSDMSDQSTQGYQPNIPIEQLRRYGFYTYIHSLISAPEPIMRYLCKTYRLHNIPIGDDTVNENFDNMPESITVFYSDKFRFDVKTSRYSKQKSTQQTEIKGDGALSLSLDILRLERLRGATAEAKSKADNCDKMIQELKTEIGKANQALSHEREQIASILRMKQEAEMIATRIRVMEKKIEDKKRTSNNREAIKAAADRKIKKVIKEMIADNKELINSYRQHSELVPRAVLNSKKLELKTIEKTHLENKILENRQRCEEALESLNAIKEECAALKTQAKSYLSKAKAMSKGFTPDDDGFNEFRATYDSLSTDFAVLQLEKDQVVSKIDCLNTANVSEMREYEANIQLIEQLKAKLENNKMEKARLNVQMERLEQEWLEPLGALVAEINYQFASAYEQMGCAGEISIDKGEDPKNYGGYGLAIKVTYREGEPLQQLNSTVQSGGERAVATAVFMLSLQELTPVPFRCADEINQGMDAGNERRIFDLLVNRIIQQDNISQYFLITPKLVPNLKYVQGMMIHIVHNGPFIGEDRQWSKSKLCNPQGVQI